MLGKNENFLRLARHAAGLALPLALATTFACKSTSGGGESEVLQLRNNNLACPGIPDRVAHIRNDLGLEQVVVGGSPAQRNEAFLHLSGVPEMYIRFLVQTAKTNGFRIYLTNGAGGTGLTWGGIEDTAPQKMEVNYTSLHHSLVHEVGHAVTGYTLYRNWINAKNPNGPIYTTFNAVVRDPAELQFMRDYPKTQMREYFAEAFASFYCSRASREDMAKTFKRSNTMMRGIGEPPPAEDEDKDGILNWKDQCSNTRQGGVLSTDPAMEGCEEGQQADAKQEVMATYKPTDDYDGDGVLNGKDQCTNTRKGVAVHKVEGANYGCEGGQIPNWKHFP